MVTFIAKRILEARTDTLEKGQERYRAYFVNTPLYVRYQAEVNAILRTDGASDVIVE